MLASFCVFEHTSFHGEVRPLKTLLFLVPPLGVHRCHGDNIETGWEDKHCHLVVTKAVTTEQTAV